VPAVKDAAWARTPIDRFLLAKMAARGVTPAAEADWRTLVRRLYFDLIGLPPKPEEVESVIAAPDFDKEWPALVERLLASPHFGERWARHWLDPARFAESHGFEHDSPRPFAYHYRDFVIRAFNRNMPYDQFVRWQIAGDELTPNDPEALAATGFLGAGVFPTQITTREAERVRYDALDDMLATTGYTMLALTVACARCHDHKYDPIPTRDYYRMLSAFTTTVRSEIEWDFGTDAEKKAAQDFEARLQPLVAERKRFEEKELPQRFTAWLAEQRVRQAPVPKVEAPLQSLLQGLWDGSRTFDKLDAKRQTELLNWFKPHDEEWTKRCPGARVGETAAQVHARQDANLHRGAEADAAAHGRRLHPRFLSANVLSQARRCGPEGRRGRARLSASLGAQLGRHGALDHGEAGRSADFLPPGRVGELAHRYALRRRSAGRARHRQSALVSPFRPGHRGHDQRLRLAG
jgi:hypothetical protein